MMASKSKTTKAPKATATVASKAADTPTPKAADAPEPGTEETNPELAQHPGGDVEVAKRDPDAESDASSEYRKVFVIQAELFDKSFDHTANIGATRQELINHGLRPTGDIVFVGKARRGKLNFELTYAGPVVPANSSAAPSDVHIDQDYETPEPAEAE